MTLRKKKFPYGQFFLNTFFILVCICYIVPLILLLSISFEGAMNKPFTLFPYDFSLAAYKMAFKAPKKIIDAYGVTIFESVVGVMSSLVLMSMFAYALSRPNFIGRRQVNFLLFFTTLFSGGMVPTYILNSTYLHLNNTIWIYIIPSLISSWNVIVIRTYFKSLPNELFESARIDGASELRICFQICIPLSTPVLASVGFLRFIDAWNVWSTTQIYIRKPELYTLQYLLQQVLNSAALVEQLINEGKLGADMAETLTNLESMRFAMAVIGAGPAMIIFPFFQKYFAKGMVVGSVKG